MLEFADGRACLIAVRAVHGGALVGHTLADIRERLQTEMLELLTPEAVSPALLALVAQEAPTRTILCAGAGSFEMAHITLTQGIFTGDVKDTAEQILARLDEIGTREGETVPASGAEQGMLELKKAGYKPLIAEKV